MRSRQPTVKLRLRALCPSILAALMAAGAGGCIIIADDDDDEVVVREPPPPPPALVTIDADHLQSAEPGDGVGVFVEYASGGRWNIRVTCDTNLSGRGCAFDVQATVLDGELFTIDAVDTEPTDIVESPALGAARLIADVSTDFDGMSLTATPGATVRIDALLDGQRDPRFIFWRGDGAEHATGAPTDPIDFQPSSP